MSENDDEILDNTIKGIEDYFFGTGDECGEKLFIQFAKENKQKFLDAKLSSSTENQFEFYTDLYQTFQGIYENKLEELVNKFNMNSEQFYNGLSRRCDEGDQEVILFVDIINEIINYNSFIEMMANLINKG